MIVALLALAATPIASTPALGTAAAQCRPHEPGPAIVVTVEGLKDRAGNLRVEIYPAVEGEFLADDRREDPGRVGRRQPRQPRTVV